jgi:hypothetical protein
LLVYRPPLKPELYEIKPYQGDSPNQQLQIYLKGLEESGVPSMLGTFPYEGILDNFPVLGVRITYEYDGPGKILYQPSINQLGQAMAVFVMGFKLMVDYNKYQISIVAQEYIETLELTKGFI